MILPTAQLPRTPRTTSADAPSSNVPSVIHVCDTAGCLRRPGSDPASHGTIGYHVCCGSCAFFNGQVHTRECQEASLTPEEYHAWTLSRVPVDAAPASSNGNDGRGASNLDDDHHREYGPHTYNLDSGDTSDAPTSTIMSAPTSTPPRMPTSASILSFRKPPIRGSVTNCVDYFGDPSHRSVGLKWARRAGGSETVARS